MRGPALVRSFRRNDHAAVLSVAAVAATVSISAAGALPALARTTTGDTWIGDALSGIRETGTAVLANLSDPTFYGTAAAGLLMLAGAGFAHAIRTRDVGWKGFPVACDSGLWGWMAGAGILALLLSHLCWGWTRSPDTPWQPLFVAFVSVTPAVVLMYGRGWKVALTAAVLGAGLTAPAAIAAATYLCVPLGVPTVAGFTAAMAVTAYISFAVCRRLPWLDLHAGKYVQQPGLGTGVGADSPQSATWMLRRVLADFTEAPFFGNEWAGAGLIAGAVLAYLTTQPTEGLAALFPQILGAQLAAGALSVIVWRGRWRAHGWYPSFVPVVSVAPAAVIAFEASPVPTLAALVLGVLSGPPLAFRIGALVPRHVHRFVGCVGSMAICTSAIVPAISLLT
ncbi:hypothetical protein [Nocardia sp. NBC_00416]|uniref:hypothetical protein n=1 Tax=Nocardia sp. NBC_00416 TaxID=2975991 RepID=UPI002E22B7C6